jgi:hypothetical protein
MMPEFVESVIHGLGLGRANPAATHGVIKHPVTILPRGAVLAVRDSQCSTEAFRYLPSKGPPMDRPKIPRNGCTIDDRTDRRDPDFPVRISVAQLSKSVIVRPSGFHFVTGSPS